MRSRIHTPKVLNLLLLTLLLLAAVVRGLPFQAQAARSIAAPAAMARPKEKVGTTRPALAQQTLPPVLTTVTPAEGTPWDGGLVTFTFDQDMAAESNVSLTVSPELAGTVTVDGATLTFTPSAAPTPGERYHFTIEADAQSAAGVALGNPVELTLVAAAPLAVTSTQPS
ncbi:MAG: Ig-like domain-containing protein, partial [Rhodospirillales bacterium]|nr:Ig-like domain-containing protein [Rhodospirillales bacterium]